MDLFDTLALILSGLALLISIGAFAYGNLVRGRIIFSQPNMYAVSRSPKGKEGNIGIAFPVNVTNTGAVLHIVNSLYGRLVKVGGGWKEYFSMQTELPRIPPPKDEPPAFATSFAVPPRSSCTKLLGFSSQRAGLDIPAGDYRFYLYAYVDGKAVGKDACLEFGVTITEEQVMLIDSGGRYVSYAHHPPQGEKVG